MHVYLHVPFCARRCSYCDFSIAVRRRVPAQEYVECVLRELELVRAEPRPGLETLYLGGGTPSLLPPEAVARVVTSLLDVFAPPPPLQGLTAGARTPLARWTSRGTSSAPDDDRYAAEYLLAHERLRNAGYHFYEVSNAALDGRRSRHNSAYWSGRPYLGLGPAAHSFDGRVRRWNLAAWETYRRAVAAGLPAVEAEEVLTEEQRDLERLYLALRTDAGAPLAALGRSLPPAAAHWVERGWAEIREQRLVCTPEGWLRLDALVRDLTDAAGAV